MQLAGGKRAREREITVTPLPGPGLCTLLEVAGYRILLDCGWSASLDAGECAARVSALGGAPLDAVLLSHGSPSHAGGLPFLRGAAAADGAPVYATAPVHRMAQLALYDALLSRSAADPDYADLSLDAIDDAFRLKSLRGSFVTVRFLESVTLAPARGGSSSSSVVSVSPVAAGHSLGAAVWQVTVSGGDDTIVYAVHFNLRAERHLPQLLPAQLASRPTLLITDACAMLERGAAPLRALALAPLREASAAAAGGGAAAAGGGGGALAPVDRALLAAVLAPLRAGGSVLLPTDSNGRALELLMRLDAAWPPAPAPPLLYLSFVGENTLEFARGMLEYMADRLTRTFVDSHAAPFRLGLQAARADGGGGGGGGGGGSGSRGSPPANVRVVSSVQDVEALMGGGGGAWRAPVAVICAFGSLDAGAARTLFLTRVAADPNAAVIFTDRLLARGDGGGGEDEGECSLAEALLTTALPASVPVTETERVPLDGAELVAWVEEVEARRKRAARAAAAARLAETERRDLQAAEAAAPAPEAAASSAAAAAAALEFVDAEDAGSDELALEQGAMPLRARLEPAAPGCPICPRAGRPASAGTAQQRRAFPVFRSMAEDEAAGGVPPASVSTTVAAAVAAAAAAAAFAPAAAAAAGTSSAAAASSIVLLSSASGGGSAQQRAAPHAATSRSVRVRDAISERLGRLLPGVDLALGAAEASSSAAAAASPAEPSEDAAAAGPPSKLQRMRTWVHAACRVSFLDVSGRCDADAVLTLIEEVAPQATVVIGGGASPAAVQAMVQALAPRVARALPAAVGECVAVPARDAVIVSYIRNTLYTSLHFERLAGCRTAFLAGAVDVRAAPDSATSEQLLLGPDLDALAAHYHAPIAVSTGAARVSALLRPLGRAGMQARIIEGGLVTGAGVVVRRAPRSDSGDAARGGGAPAAAGLLLEGQLSAEFFAARTAVQGSFTVL